MPLPPVARRSSWLQPRDMCEAFQDLAYTVSVRPRRSECPTMALPKVLLVQLLHVRLRLPGNARPSMVEPVTMSRPPNQRTSSIATEPMISTEGPSTARTRTVRARSRFGYAEAPVEVTEGGLFGGAEADSAANSGLLVAYSADASVDSACAI